MVHLAHQAISLERGQGKVLCQEQVLGESRNFGMNTIRRKRVQLRQIHTRDYRSVEAGLNFLKSVVYLNSFFQARARAIAVVSYVSFAKCHNSCPLVLTI